MALETDLNIGPTMRKYLHKIGAHVEPGGRSNQTGESIYALSSYLHAHYDSQNTLLERLPETHPLAVFLRDYRKNDLYAVLLNMLAPHLQPDGMAIDIGCHVGRLTRDLAALGQHIIGVDISFKAVFLARQAVRGWPHALDEYEYFRDGLVREIRPLCLPPLENAEVLVASALSLPFRPEAFDLAVSANVVDIVPDPIAVLREMRFVLREQGWMALSTPYHSGAVQAAERWLGAESRMGASQALRWRIGHHFEIVEERDNIPWVLGENERHFQIYLNHCMVGRKLPPRVSP
jgi:SAM-dependent methyltransferase